MRKHISVLFLALLVFVSLCVGGCATPSGSGGKAGGAQPASNIAQTVGRSQAAVPSQSYGGDVHFTFASVTTAEVQKELIEYAAEAKASVADLTKLLAATNGAPESVHITTNDIRGGDADAAGAGEVGDGSASAGGGTVERP